MGQCSGMTRDAVWRTIGCGGRLPLPVGEDDDRRQRRALGSGYRSRMNNLKLPHLSKLQWAFMILVLLFLIYLVVAGVIGGHG